MDLRKLGWRWTWSDDHEKGHAFDPYHVRILGKYGTVHLARDTPGDVLLGAWTTSRRKLNELELAGAKVTARGDDEGIARFPFALLPKMASIIRLHRKAPGRSPEFLAKIRPALEGGTFLPRQGTIATPSIPDVVQTDDRVF